MRSSAMCNFPHPAPRSVPASFSPAITGVPASSATIEQLAAYPPVVGGEAELMWRLSMPLSVLILGLLAVPLSYFNPRTGHTYNILLAVGAYLLYQNGLTFLRGAVESGKLPFLLGFLPMHVLMLALAWWLIRYRSQPAGPMWASVRASLKVGRS